MYIWDQRAGGYFVPLWESPCRNKPKSFSVTQRHTALSQMCRTLCSTLRRDTKNTASTLHFLGSLTEVGCSRYWCPQAHLPWTNVSALFPDRPPLTVLTYIGKPLPADPGCATLRLTPQGPVPTPLGWLVSSEVRWANAG